MYVIHQLFEIDALETVLKESFIDNKKKWEQLDTPSELATIQDGAYQIENRTKSRWNFYKQKFPIRPKEDFMITASFEIGQQSLFGHCGWIWGFNTEFETLNKFTTSVTGSHVIMHFERNHKKRFHHFYNMKEGPNRETKIIRLSVVKIKAYYYFLSQENIIYVAHESHFSDVGSHFGIYVEPQMNIKVRQLQVKRINARTEPIVNGIHTLID